MKKLEAAIKIADHVRERGESRVKRGAYTLVREHCEVNFNKAIGH